MKNVLFALCLLTLLPGTHGSTVWGQQYNEENPISGERDYILRIFGFYAQLQRNFERENYSARSRDLVEDYTMGILLPACASCAKLLRRGRDTELMLSYFRLLQFTQHSASESF